MESSRSNSIKTAGKAVTEQLVEPPLSKATYEIRKIEIIAKQYKHPLLRVLLIFNIFLVSYAYGLDAQTRYVYTAQAASSYNTHSLYATVNVIKAVIAAAAQFAFARLSDVFGRLELFIVSILFYVVGTIIQSQSYDIQRFAGGSVLYQIGYTGVILLMQLILADQSNLNWRLLCSFVPALPFIINTWISGNVTGAVGSNWSWGIGMWAFIFPLACIPLLVCLIHMRFMAGRTEEWAELQQQRKEQVQSKSFVEAAVDLFWKIDVIGLLMVIIVFGLILVPFTIAGGVHDQWKKGKIIAPLVIGFVAIPFFILWEAKFAKYPLIPGHLLKERGVWSAVVIGICIDLVWYMPNDYMYTVLIVAVNESVKSATRITSLYSFVSVITGTIFGLAVVKLRNLKKYIIFGACLWFVANGLLVYFRGDTNSHSGIIGALCLFGFGAGLFTYPVQASIQSCTSHKNMASVTALYLSSYNIGAAMGASISGAVWTQLLYKNLVKHIGDATLATTAYGSPFTFILSYPWGTPEREATVIAYRYVQKILCIIGLCCCVPLLVATLFLRGHRLESVQSLQAIEEQEKDDKLLKVKFGGKTHKETDV